jgi:hypothetical protein
MGESFADRYVSRRRVLRTVGTSLVVLSLGTTGAAAATGSVDGTSYSHDSRVEVRRNGRRVEYDSDDDDNRFRSRRSGRSRRTTRRRNGDVDVDLRGGSGYVRYERDSDGSFELDTDDVSVDYDDGDLEVDVHGDCRVVSFESDGDDEFELDLGDCGRIEVG